MGEGDREAGALATADAVEGESQALKRRSDCTLQNLFGRRRIVRVTFPFHRFALFHALPLGCLSAARLRSPSPMLRTGEERQ